ncbi:MAG: hypothetical protein OXI63_06915 [Candidatus Poribacteria bacterium]|nr:hypothetical protein [Candidatus Poribacteria bacterium]
MEYALRQSTPVVAKKALIRAFRDGDRAVLDQDGRVVHVCKAVRRVDYACVACNGPVRKRSAPGGSGRVQFWHQNHEDRFCVDTSRHESLDAAFCQKADDDSSPGKSDFQAWLDEPADLVPPHTRG